MDHHGLRPLLPAPPRLAQESASANRPPKTRRNPYVKLACNPCRRRKTKCDSLRPACSNCLTHQFTCEYADIPSETPSQALKRKHSELEQHKSSFESVYRILQTKTEEEASAILRQIRTGADPETILRHIQDGDLLLQLSLVPETRYRYEFPYLTRMPSFLCVPDNPYIDSLVYEGTFGASSSVRRLSQDHPGDVVAPYLKPYQSAHVVDARISSATAAPWTSVISDDSLFRSLLNLYFLFDYPFLPSFQKDLFLQDLADGNRRFCSSLLVNAILTAACHSNRDHADRMEIWNPRTLSYQFLAETKRLWELESDQCKITTVQAALILVAKYNMSGLDQIGTSYLAQAAAMARKSKLFTSSEEIKSKRMRRCREFTAWALFAFQGLVTGVYYHKTPMVREPPEFPLPDPIEDPAWYGELWLKYPLNQTLYPLHFGSAFRAICELRMIMNNIAIEAFGDAENHGRLSRDQVLKFKSKVDLWMDNLAPLPKPGNIVFPLHMKIHMEAYYTILFLFEPFLETQADTGHSTVAEDSPRSTHALTDDAILQAISSARMRMETLLRLYYLRHSFEYQDVYIMTFFLKLGFSSLTALKANPHHENADQLRSTLILYAKGILDQARSSHLSSVVFCVLQDAMDPEDVELLAQHFPFNDIMARKSLMGQHVKSEWPLPIIKMGEDPESALLENLIQDYKEVSLGSSSDSDSSS